MATPVGGAAPSTRNLLAPFADALIAHDLPALPVDRRRASIEFALARVGVMPGPMRSGVILIAVAIRLAVALAGAEPVVRATATSRLPLVAEYVRLHRSLVYAYVWETWPATHADGSPG
jgi:hypothetical protein